MKKKLVVFTCFILTMLLIFPGMISANATSQPFNANQANAKVLVNGVLTDFEAYNINGNNYFKLRDIAIVVSGTQKQFEVSWDEGKRAINLVSSSAYTPAGGELAKGDGKPKQAVLNSSAIYKDGRSVALTSYNIGGYNFFKLRDLTQAFNIGVTWNGATSTVGIDTALEYIEESVPSGPDLTEVTKKYNEVADIFNEAAKHVNANGWKDDPEILKQHNELADVIDEIKYIIEDPEQSKEIDAGTMSKELDNLISALKEYKAAVAVTKEGYATDEQKKEMVEMLVQMFNGVNTDFNGMVVLLNEKGLIVDGTELTENLLEFTAILQGVRDGLTGETMTSADAEEFLDKIEATDQFIVETIDAYLK